MTLFGDYVDIVKGFLAADGVGLAVIVVQFAKIKTYRGIFCLFFVINIFLNFVSLFVKVANILSMFALANV